jgi:hypothetical protein
MGTTEESPRVEDWVNYKHTEMLRGAALFWSVSLTRTTAAGGIKFLFTSFEQFFAEIGPKPSKQFTLDRIENNGNYEPGNIRWATRLEQTHNRRCTRKGGAEVMQNTKKKESRPIDSDAALIAALRLLRTRSMIIERDAGVVDIYLDVVGRMSHRRGLKITLRDGVLIGIHCRAQCKRDICWKYIDGESAQRVCDRVLAQCHLTDLVLR